MAIALVNVSGGHNSTGSTVASISTNASSLTAGNLLVVGVRSSSTTAPTMSDTATNTFGSPVNSVSDVGGDTVWEYRVANCLGNASNVVKASFSPSVNYVAIISHQYSGADTTSPYDVSATGNTSGGTSITSGSFTPTNTGDVGVAFGSVGALGVTWTAGANYTKQRTEDFFQSEDRLSTGTSSQTAAISCNTSADMQIVVATYKPATAAGWGGLLSNKRNRLVVS